MKVCQKTEKRLRKCGQACFKSDLHYTAILAGKREGRRRLRLDVCGEMIAGYMKRG